MCVCATIWMSQTQVVRVQRAIQLLYLKSCLLWYTKEQNKWSDVRMAFGSYSGLEVI